jgi:hypothetical protein
LCPADKTLDEECFQQMPLQYANNTSKLFWLAPESGRVDKPIFINATRLTVRNEQDVWTKIPIPAYKCLAGHPVDDATGKPNSCPDEPQFAPPSGLSSDNWGMWAKDVLPGGADAPDAYIRSKGQMKWFPFIGDYVKVPDTPGRYVLSWRWDSEQTPQIWTNCADIYIQDKKPVIL